MENSSDKTANRPFFTPKMVQNFLTTLSVIYLIIGILSLLGFLLEIVAYFVQSDAFSNAGIMLFLVMGLVGGAFYIGLRRAKYWVVYGIYILSIIAIINHLLHFTADLLSLIFLCFFIFQIYFFFRKDVRTHFYKRGFI